MPWEGVKGLGLRVNYFKELFVCFVSGNKTAQFDFSNHAAKVVIKWSFCCLIIGTNDFLLFP